MRACGSVQLAFSQRRSRSVWEGAGKVKLLICSLVIHSLIKVHPVGPFEKKTVCVTEQSTALK